MPLEPLLDAPDKQIYYGFDIETAVDKQGRHTFLCCSLVNAEHNYRKIFRDPALVLKEMVRLKRITGAHFVATNLHFDLFELFKQLQEKAHLEPKFRKSRLLFAKFPYMKSLDRKHKRKYMIFIDTVNFLPFSVEKLGEQFLKLPKLSKPSFIARKPKNIMEWSELETYCIRDAEITQRSMKQIHDLFYHFEKFCADAGIPLPKGRPPQIHGSKTKYTAAATALDNYRRFFMGENAYKIPTHRQLDDIFKAYYGGRVEAFCRGTFKSTRKKNIRCYDINSMYPYVMKKYAYPDPNSMEERTQMKPEDLLLEGVCFARMHCPDMKVPYLPHREEKRLNFPIGTFEGWYTTFELREALRRDYKILSLGRGYVFTKTCRPFVEYVDVWYALRKFFKKKKDPYEQGAKLAMNSLYGRFALTNQKERKVIHADDMTLERVRFYERQGFAVYQPSEHSEWFYIEKDGVEYTDDIVPIWSIYCTAYARHELYGYMTQCAESLMYVDTDSITCMQDLPVGDELGQMKLEKDIDEIIIVRPKMYAYREREKKRTHIKVKGLPMNMAKDSLTWFRRLLRRRKAAYKHWMKFATAQKLYGGKIYEPNQIMQLEKDFSLEDSKRIWHEEFSITGQQWSDPLRMER